jgi:hypothetical protein
MTKATTKTFGEFLVQVGDGASPEVFAAPCGLTAKGFNQSASTQETSVPDCTNPDAPAYVERAVDTISAEITGSGVMATEAFTTWQAWFDSSLSKNCRVYPKGSSGGYWSGLFILSSFNLTVNRGQKVEVSVTMVSDGQYIWTPVMRLTAITLPWADGEFTFDLRLGEIRKLQDKTGVGPAVILNRIQTDQWKVDDYRETILQGLLGGGMEAGQARTLDQRLGRRAPRKGKPSPCPDDPDGVAGWCAPGKKDSAGDRQRDDDGTGRLDFDAIYGTGAAIGFDPRAVDQWSLAEFVACVEGWKRANGVEDKPSRPSDDAFERMLAEAGL